MNKKIAYTTIAIASSCFLSAIPVGAKHFSYETIIQELKLNNKIKIVSSDINFLGTSTSTKLIISPFKLDDNIRTEKPITLTIDGKSDLLSLTSINTLTFDNENKSDTSSALKLSKNTSFVIEQSNNPINNHNLFSKQLMFKTSFNLFSPARFKVNFNAKRIALDTTIFNKKTFINADNVSATIIANSSNYGFVFSSEKINSNTPTFNLNGLNFNYSIYNNVNTDTLMKIISFANLTYSKAQQIHQPIFRISHLKYETGYSGQRYKKIIDIKDLKTDLIGNFGRVSNGMDGDLDARNINLTLTLDNTDPASFDALWDNLIGLSDTKTLDDQFNVINGVNIKKAEFSFMGRQHGSTKGFSEYHLGATGGFTDSALGTPTFSAIDVLKNSFKGDVELSVSDQLSFLNNLTLLDALKAAPLHQITNKDDITTIVARFDGVN